MVSIAIFPSYQKMSFGLKKNPPRVRRYFIDYMLAERRFREEGLTEEAAREKASRIETRERRKIFLRTRKKQVLLQKKKF
ncbi:MAG: hypothetical protein COT39_04115 [Parcubacteria group bacterium CG08_land_8_20_14_0_20_48_21]|nr:MAG: hypothetical protein AUK21_00740 [Parcubacteria group bacterium CG2_30_48_51]PIS32500.1 MAG: hypothetical protein COT39_04115 [Parcubacteria group bacterium CG08_land_8_20_14_0_20_48_21]PIW79541.1 MAG: hypothetical protein COZ99_00625 [Parcubacteria group bacterium CG_4_8_14_3_um_filter_48_16]PIY78085.1 MAG: hypothetical protein COY83_01635 [Parcubacteria group bacterium CG_4_10_14_0_8_um_filter_48_154]PJC39861.1 MAG: hypothetical protein CO043_01880 [Parcubacteria group bacterium CG_4_